MIEDLAERFRVHFSEKIMNVRNTMYNLDAPLPVLTETIVIYARNASQSVTCNYDSRRVWVPCNASADSTGHRHFPGQRNGHVDVRLPTSNCTTSPRYATA